MTCWRRLRDWQAAGVFEAMYTMMLAHYHRAGLIDFDRVIPDGSHVRAKKGAPTPAQPGRPPQNITSHICLVSWEFWKES
ncbi:hypothetical protein [Nocardia salmonicida]|uniref:hypothetical protein n=1 Tax=Nocardia salmonicida TaxID=53431 RepID=UPI0007C683B7|nr:hypothetical protein [Nocardia salmonicida]